MHEMLKVITDNFKNKASSEHVRYLMHTFSYYSICSPLICFLQCTIIRYIFFLFDARQYSQNSTPVCQKNIVKTEYHLGLP